MIICTFKFVSFSLTITSCMPSLSFLSPTSPSSLFLSSFSTSSFLSSLSSCTSPLSSLSTCTSLSPLSFLPIPSSCVSAFLSPSLYNISSTVLSACLCRVYYCSPNSGKISNLMRGLAKSIASLMKSWSVRILCKIKKLCFSKLQNCNIQHYEL